MPTRGITRSATRFGCSGGIAMRRRQMPSSRASFPASACLSEALVGACQKQSRSRWRQREREMYGAFRLRAMRLEGVAVRCVLRLCGSPFALLTRLGPWVRRVLWGLQGLWELRVLLGLRAHRGPWVRRALPATPRRLRRIRILRTPLPRWGSHDRTWGRRSRWY